MMLVEDIAVWTPWTAVGITGLLLIYFLMNPNKVEKWSAVIAGLIEKINTRAARHSAAAEVQSATSAYVSETNSGDILPYGLKIGWIKDSTVESYVDARKESVVVIMPYRKNISRIFVTAVREYTSKAFIPKIRHDIPRQVVTAAELVMQEKIIRAKRQDALDMFKTEVLPLQIGTDRDVERLYKSFKQIGESGFFENIFLNELLIASDGLKTFAESQKAMEIDDLIDFLVTFYERSPGEEIRLEYTGKLFKLNIILVAKTEKMMLEGTGPYTKSAEVALSKGLRSIYVTGTKDDRKYVSNVVRDISEQGIANLEWAKDYKKVRNIKVQNYTIAFFRR